MTQSAAFTSKAPAEPDFRELQKRSFEAHKKNSLREFAYSKRISRLMAQYCDSPDLCMAFFDKDCVLMRLFGTKEALRFAADRKIRIGTSWSEADLGPNAVCIGMRDLSVEQTLAGEAASPLLSDVSVYFCPYILEGESGPSNFHQKAHGGIALLVRKGCEEENYPMTIACMANDVSVHLYMSESYEKLQSSEESRGFVCFDIDTETGKPHILYHNRRLFKVLGIPENNLYFKDVTYLFDPLPKNRALWNLIRSPRSMQETTMNLSVHGHEQEYRVSCEYYHQERLRLQGLRLTISSAVQYHSYISKKTGNIANKSFNEIVGQAPAFLRAIKKAKLIAQNDSNVLLIGESGSGKDVFAQAIHNASSRRNNPFVAVNCAAFSRDLISSELFGYADGAFTGARKGGTIGKFQLADSGTLFLDEIGDMPLELQPVLLRVIEQKQFMQVGGQKPISVDVRMIFATNADLKQKIRQKLFREDLYYRISTLKLDIPPLRDRREDIVPLAEYFIRHICERLGRVPLRLSEESEEYLMSLPWTGNVRELQNVMESCVILCTHDIIEPSDIEENVTLDRGDSQPHRAETPASELLQSRPPVRKRRKVTREEILNAFEICGGNRSRAAELLQISRKTLYRWLDRYGMD